MTKNKLEKIFSKSLQSDIELWFMKLHNNPLAHQTTPADYILSYQQSIFPPNLQLHLVECKQVTCCDGKGRFAFKRLKQMYDLIQFEEKVFHFHNGWLCLAYYDRTWANSEVYLIPIKVMQKVIHDSSYVSINREDAKERFKNFKLFVLPGSILDLALLKS